MRCPLNAQTAGNEPSRPAVRGSVRLTTGPASHARHRGKRTSWQQLKRTVTRRRLPVTVIDTRTLENVRRAKGKVAPSIGSSDRWARPGATARFLLLLPTCSELPVHARRMGFPARHAADQLRLFSAKQWPRLPFHPEEVARERVGPVLELRRER